jgi:tripartite-type tricarboxylate transporter receptor subunit TctC
MVIMPAKTPDHIIDTLHNALREFQITEGFKTTVSRWGLEPVVTPSRQELIRFVERALAKRGCRRRA